MHSPGQEALSRPFTQKDLDFTPDDGNLYEVIDGELFVSPFPTYPHQWAGSQLHTILNQHIRQKKLGSLFFSGLKVVLDELSGLGPDIVYISNARMTHMQEDGFYGVPDLVVEVLSSKPQLDRFVKLRKYASAGVPHYWIVDPKQRMLSIYRLSGDHYELMAEPKGNEHYEPELFPDLSIALRELWVL